MMDMPNVDSLGQELVLSELIQRLSASMMRANVLGLLLRYTSSNQHTKLVRSEMDEHTHMVLRMAVELLNEGERKTILRRLTENDPLYGHLLRRVKQSQRATPVLLDSGRGIQALPSLPM